MRKLICVLLSLCLLTSLGFCDVPLIRRNFIVEKHLNLELLIPSAIFGVGAYWLWLESDKPKNKTEDDQLGMRIISVSLAFASVLFFAWAFTPETEYLFPKLGEDGKTIWLEKQIEW